MENSRRKEKKKKLLWFLSDIVKKSSEPAAARRNWVKTLWIPDLLFQSLVSLSPAEAPVLFLPSPVTLLCHILFSQALLFIPPVSARHWPDFLGCNTTLIEQQHRSILWGPLYTNRNKGSKSEFQSLTLVSSKASAEAVRPFAIAAVASFLLFFPFLLPGGRPASLPWAQWPRNPPALRRPSSSSNRC